MNRHVSDCDVARHWLRLADWGPYSKKYIGISHIPDRRAGFRFDLSVFFGLYRRKVEVPNVNWEAAITPGRPRRI